MPLKLAMLGTGTFALPTFRQLVDSSHEVELLVTQPDRTGRGHHKHTNPLKELAEQHDIAVFQPENIKTEESLGRLREFEVDLYVTAAYGQILSAAVLDVPRLGAINLHGSLLPKYRGAAPVQYSVINGDTETGVTVFQIEPKLDAGPMLGVVKTPIGPQETAGELHDRLADLAAPLAVDVIDRIARGTIDPLIQDSSEVTRAPKLTKEDGLIDWSRSARLVDAQIRGVQPWPKPLTYWLAQDREPTQLLITAVEEAENAGQEDADQLEPGTVEVSPDGRLLVTCGDGFVQVMKVKPPGKREMTGEEFARGYPIRSGDRFQMTPELRP